ncbi:MAG: thioredoxin domain-containing protein [Gammaproteobacteria bacterium]|nr:thioredoxin domain-containing protein [Gammaproteobacteria bacterium]
MKINRLSKESSPYLLQHANNPVDWFPWNNDALEKAKNEKKPILLSIGYSACHWCHVMAHESFEDIDTANIMNKNFINIKVDREERPDIDKIYQNAQILLNQRTGGWPLTMFLSHDNQIPFYGGTYFPKEQKYNLPAFKDLLTKISEYYKKHYDEIKKQDDSMIKALDSIYKPSKKNNFINEDINESFIENIKSSFDKEMGGFGSAPKFPQTTIILHALKYEGYSKKDILYMPIRSLEAMQEGGINDHIGGGFFRYSVDDIWMIPHFEKMLYDNALLLECYCLAYQITKKNKFYKTALSISLWIINDMKSENGNFYSSIDADSEGGEGKYYIWDTNEIKSCLTNDEYKIFSNRFGLEKGPNFEGKYHLYYFYKNKESFRCKKNIFSKAELIKIDSSIKKLKSVRDRRKSPEIDKKSLTSWNALTISSLIKFYNISKDEQFLVAAEDCLEFVLANMLVGDSLYATYKDDTPKYNGYLDDYAFLLNSIINFLMIKWSKYYLDYAVILANKLVEDFHDKKNGGFFFTDNNHEKLIQRPKPTSDDATPSGNGMATIGLLKLGFLLGQDNYIRVAESTFSYSSVYINEAVTSHCTLLDGYLMLRNNIVIIILKGESDNCRIWKDIAMNSKKSNAINIFTVTKEKTGYENLDNKKSLSEVTAYICIGKTCEVPINDIKDFSHRLNLL